MRSLYVANGERPFQSAPDQTGNTLLLGVSGKIPCVKIHGVLRFEEDAIKAWLQSFAVSPVAGEFVVPKKKPNDSIETLIARAKRAVYTSRPGKPDQQRAQSEGRM